MLFQRESGILLHPSSLPGPFGIGELGPDAFRFIDLLVAAKQSIWQLLPLTPPGNGFSPYQSGSSFAGNPLLLSLQTLQEQGLLEPLDSSVLDALRTEVSSIDTERVLLRKTPLVRHAAAQFVAEMSPRERELFNAFREEKADWLRDYARYQAIQRSLGGKPWCHWPEPLRRRDPRALASIDVELEAAIVVEEALQYLFESQWQSVRRYANERGVRILGDLPIFVSLDSADVWTAQHLFKLDEHGMPRVVAGVPPDYFSKTGQRWGNPMYDWGQHQAEGFAWWVRRVKRTLEMADILRIDHFRGFAACWEIPSSEPTAINGQWVVAPGQALFERLQAIWGSELPIVAEDLGIITDDVVALRDRFGLATMRILQFSFGGEEKLLPRNYPRNCIAYTGTHDNDTLVGWYAGDVNGSLLLPEQVLAERDRVRRYYATDGTDIHWTCIKALLESQCAAAIFPLQDVIGLGSEARMNMPGTVGGHNWTWRFDWPAVEERMIRGLRFLTEQAGRNSRLG